MFVKNYTKYGFRKTALYEARTLKLEYLGRHESGWIIMGKICEDYFEWVNDFVAYNENTGEMVAGNFENYVIATSEETLNNFLEEFPYKEWDYGDIQKGKIV